MLYSYSCLIWERVTDFTRTSIELFIAGKSLYAPSERVVECGK